MNRRYISEIRANRKTNNILIKKSAELTEEYVSITYTDQGVKIIKDTQVLISDFDPFLKTEEIPLSGDEVIGTLIKNIKENINEAMDIPLK